MWPGPLLIAGPGLYRIVWLNVMVHAEEVCRIIFVLQSHQPIVIAAVGLARDGVALVGDVIAVRTSHQKRPQTFPTFARPSNVLFCLGGVGPDGPGKEVP